MQPSDISDQPCDTIEQPSAAYQKLFGFNEYRFVERTALATIWKVTLTSGDFAALKVYHNGDMRGEATGFDFLRACGGVAAANVLDQTTDAALIEWLDGPSLGDLSRQGADRESAEHLADVARRLHAGDAKHVAGLPIVSDWLDSLFKLEFHKDCPVEAAADIGLCKVWGRELLNSQGELIALHGDLHQDNVRLGARGYCTFDAKGVMGERCYELANAFRNPKGAVDTVNDPARIEMLADTFSQGLSVDRQRLLKWAAAKCALSIAWRAGEIVTEDVEFGLLAKLIAAAK